MKEMPSAVFSWYFEVQVVASWKEAFIDRGDQKECEEGAERIEWKVVKSVFLQIIHILKEIQ